MGLGWLILGCVVGTIVVVVALALGTYIMPYVLGGLVIAVGVYEGWQRGGDQGWIIGVGCGLGGALFILFYSLFGGDDEGSDKKPKKRRKKAGAVPPVVSESPVMPAALTTPTKACYRKLPKYKYQLVADCVTPIGIAGVEAVHPDYIELASDGKLTVKNEYAWDGPSGPTIDTLTFMRGSLVHDALYQLMRLGLLDRDEHRKAADMELRRICIEDGMWRFRAWYVYWAVRMFGKGAATAKATRKHRIVCVP